MKKIILRVLPVLLVLCLLCGCGGGSTVTTESTVAETETEVKKDPAEGFDLTTTPVLQLRINEKDWVYADLTPYLGQEFAWVSFPVEMSSLTEGFNQFALHSNTYNYGNLTNKSLDLFFTITDVAYDSYISTNMMSTWDSLPDRYADLILELYDGEQWLEFPENTEYRLDANTVVGIYTNSNGIFNSCRVIQIDDPTKYKAARVSALVHVGTDLLDVPEPEPIDEGDGYSELDTTEPVLLVKLNGGPCERVRLKEYAGQDCVWITQELDYARLIDGTNRVLLDSNVDNTENFSEHSIDLYCSPHRSSTDTELSTDGRLSWIKYEDHRYANMYLELHDPETDSWVKLNEEEIYRSDREHFVIGTFSANEWTERYHCRRLFTVTDLDKYDGVRVSIMMHVGSDLKMIEQP